MSLSINQVVNAQILSQAQAAARRDLSMIAIFTPETGDAFTDAETRYVTVASAQDVANLFGTKSATYQTAQALFSVRPTPNKAIIARWAKSKQDIPATSNALKGATISMGINELKLITDGSLGLIVSGQEVAIKNLDLSTAIDMQDIATALSGAVSATGLSVIYDKVGHRFIIQSNTAGEDPKTKIGYAQALDEGTYLGKILKLESGQASIVTGANALSINAETPAQALSKLNEVYQNWYGTYFADAISDEQLEDIHSWVITSELPRVMAYTALRDEQLAWNSSNVIKRLYDKNSGRLMVQYNKTGDDHAALILLGIALSTNWNAINSAKTVKFKQQSNVRADDRITLNEAAKARRLSINFYTDYDGIAMLAEGVMVGGTFIDEIVGLDAFLDACQKQAFSTLQTNATKVPQTDKGQAMLIGALTVVGEEFVRNGLLAGGVWRGNDVGELTYGDRLDAGYYFYSDSYDLQSIADREARRAMPIMCAVKLAGAIHSVDLIIQFNR